MINNKFITNGTNIRSVMNKNKIHYMNLCSGSTLQYEFNLKETSVVTLDTLFLENVHNANVKNTKQSLMIDWGDGEIAEIYEEYINTRSNPNEKGITLEHVYTVPIGTNIVISIVSEDVAYVVSPSDVDDVVNGISITKMGGTIPNLVNLNGTFNPIIKNINTIYSISSNTEDTLFSEYNGTGTVCNDLFKDFVNLESVPGNMFIYKFQIITSIDGMFENTKVNNIDIDMFSNMYNLESAKRLFKNNKALTSIGPIFEACYKLRDVEEMFRYCSSLRYVDAAIFKNLILEDADYLFEGTNAIDILSDNVFGVANTSTISITGGMKDIPGLILSGNICETFEHVNYFTETFKNSGSVDSSFEDTVYKQLPSDLFNDGVSITDGEDMFSIEKDESEFMTLSNSNITLIGNESGHVNIRNLLANRNIEVLSNPFQFSDNVESIDYTDCFKGGKSLYPDEVIFGDYYNPEISSGLTQINAVNTFILTTNIANQEVTMLSSMNSHNRDFDPEHGAYCEIDYGDGTDKVIMDEDYLVNTMMNTNGTVTHNYEFIGTYTIVVTYRWCAPFSPVYYSYDETFDLESADVHLFPTTKPYLKYGTELFHAKSVNGDLYNLFYDKYNFTGIDNDNDWLSYLMSGFNERCTSVSSDMLNSSSYLRNVDTLSHLFDTEYIGKSRSYKVNPFNAISYTFFTLIADKIKNIEYWFGDNNAHYRQYLIDLSETDITSLLSEFTSLERINTFLNLFSLSGDLNVIDWSKNEKLNYINRVYGTKDVFDWELFHKPLLSEIHYIHDFYIPEGYDATYLEDKYKDFSALSPSTPVDISNMLNGEVFEIPDGFIRNVTGTFEYTNCFKTSYRIGIFNDSSLFVNVPLKTDNDASGITLITQEECLETELVPTTTDKTIHINLFDFGYSKGDIDMLVRVYDDQHRLLRTRHIYDFHDVEKTMYITPEEATSKLTVEMWSTTVNAEYYMLEYAKVSSLKGSFGNPYWREVEKPMCTLYPGLNPNNIICTDDGGPWKNLYCGWDSYINFQDLFKNTLTPIAVDYRLFKIKNATKNTKVTMYRTFYGCDISEIDIRMFEEIGGLIRDTQSFGDLDNINVKIVGYDKEIEPYKFMEVLFTCFSYSSGLFTYNNMTLDIFNNAPFMGCNRIGEPLTLDEQTLTYFSYLGESHSEEKLPPFNNSMTYKLTNIKGLFKNMRWEFNDECDYGIMPTITGSSLDVQYAYALKNSTTDIQTVNLNTIELKKGYNAKHLYDLDGNIKLKFNKDYEFINVDSGYTNTIYLDYMFDTMNGKLEGDEYKLLIEPITESFSTATVSVGNAFKIFDTYAPDDILFRNALDYTGSSGANKLEYPSYIEYKDIHLVDGANLIFEREELNLDNRASTYLTVNVDYGDGYEEEWYVIDKNDNTFTLELDDTRIVDSKVTIKLQSTQCFYLTKTNVDKVEYLNGSYSKGLQPEDSEFFNFKPEYIYFIENLDGNLFNLVKLSTVNPIVFAYNETSYLKTVDGKLFINQSHITNIDYMFKDCIYFEPGENLFIGLTKVTSAVSLFENSGVSSTACISNLPKVEDLSYAFLNADNIHEATTNTFINNTHVISLEGVFKNAKFIADTVLPAEFFSNISSTVINMSSMFENCEGLTRVNGGPAIEYDSFEFRNDLVTTNMFANTGIIDVDILSVKSGSLLSTNSVGMFTGCKTFSNQSEFEDAYGDSTGIQFKASSYYIFKGYDLHGTFTTANEIDVDYDSYVKLVLSDTLGVQTSMYYMTYNELMTGEGLTGSYNYIKIYSEFPVLLNSTNVTQLCGKLSSDHIVINDETKLGNKYPNLDFIESTFLSGLTEQVTFEGLFENLHSISLIPDTLFKYNTKLENVSKIFKNAGGGLPTYNTTLFINNPLITDYSEAFMNTYVKKIEANSLNISTDCNFTNMFNGSDALVANGFLNFTGTTLDITDMLLGCTSMYTEEELYAMDEAVIITGTSGIDTLSTFNFTIEATTDNFLVKPYVMSDENSSSDVMIDWGDNKYSRFDSISIDNESENKYQHKYITSGSYDVKVFTDNNAVCVKKFGEDTNTLITSISGYIGKHIGPVNKFFEVHLPNVTSIENKIFWNTNITNANGLFKNSKLTSIPNNIFERLEGVTEITSMVSLFEGCENLTEISEFVFSNFNNNTVYTDSTIDVTAMFYGCKILSNIPDTLFDPLIANGLLLDSYDQIFTGTAISTYPQITIAANYVKPTSTTAIETFRGTNITTVPSYLFNGTAGLNDIDSLFRDTESLVFTDDYMINNSYLLQNEPVISMKNILNLSSDLPKRRIDKVLIEFRDDLVLNVEGALTNNKSMYSESEIFDCNKLIGNSGLVTDPRTMQSFTVTAGTLVLNHANTNTYEDAVIIRVNGRIIKFQSYTDDIYVYDLKDNDVVDVIVMGVDDVYYTVNVMNSTATVIGLGGVLNIAMSVDDSGTVVCNRRIIDMFGSDIKHIDDGFFEKYSTLEDATSLLKGMYNLETVGPNFMDNFTNVTNWSSFFEDCDNLVLTDENTKFFEVANKGVYYDYMFKNCISITTIPPKFFEGCKQDNKSFIGTFINCSGLVSIPDDIDSF